MIPHKSDSANGAGEAAAGRGLLHVLLFFLPVLISYAGALGTGFLGDDQGRILGNEDLLGGPLRAVSSGLKDRPVLMLSLWLDVRLWGVNPFALRLVNVFLHSLAGLALWRVLEALRRRHRPLGPPAGPLLLALFFALHPLHNQAVNLIVQRGVILSALFMLASLLAFLAYLEGGSRRDLLLSVLGFVLSILSKPCSSFFPFFLLGYLALDGRLKEKARAVAPHFAALALPMIFYYVLGENPQLGTVVDRGTYLLTQARVTLVYLKLFFFPYGLHYFYDVEPSLGLLDHFTWAALAVHGLFALLVVRLFRSNRAAAFFFAATYLALLPESGLFPILHLAFEHRTYLPLLFLTAALAQLPLVPSSPRRAAALFLPLFGAMLILNGIRNREITPREDWIVNTLRHSQGFPSVNLLYTVELFEGGRADDAAQAIERLEGRYPGAPIYELLRLVGEYYRPEGASRREALEKVGAYLRQVRNIYPKYRYLVNRFVIEKLSLEAEGPELAVRVADLLCPQMDEIAGSKFNHAANAHFRESMARTCYRSLTDLQRYYAAQPPAPGSAGHREALRVSAMLERYFNGAQRPAGPGGASTRGP